MYMTDKHVSFILKEVTKYGPCTKALLSMGQDSSVYLLAGWFMAMKLLQWEERESLAKLPSYSHWIAERESLAIAVMVSSGG